MKLLISIVSYLLKDIFWRWREQPGNVITRLTVAYALVLPSLALLGAFVLMAGNLETRLKRSGIDSLFIYEHVPPASDAIAARQHHPRLAHLAQYGNMFQLLQLPASGRNIHAPAVRAVEYPDTSLAALSGMISSDEPVVYLSDNLPVGIPVRTELDGHFFNAPVRRPAGMVGKYYQGDLLLMPEGMLPRVESRGFSRITFFKANDLAMLSSLHTAIQVLADLDLSNLYVRSSLKLLEEFGALKSRQAIWRLGLAVSAGGVLALVLGTLSVLEYQQRAYVIALLRSFGVRPGLVYFLQLFENAVVVNAAALMAYATLQLFQQAFYRSFGAGARIASLTASGMVSELVLIFVCINIGVLLGTIPAIHVLRKDIGAILS
jgi:hypothetical protein